MIQMLTNLVLAIAGNNDIKVVLILILFGLMVVGLVLGQELAFVLGGAGVIVGAVAMGDSGVTIAMTKIYDQMQSYSMVAIPMFVLMANFLTHSKVADGLFESIRYLLGPLKGGLGLAVILVSTVFAATTGIVGASVVTMGMLSLPILLRSGYKPSLACGMVCAGGSLGILIPPSAPMVMFCVAMECSVGRMFMAGFIPGILLAIAWSCYVYVYCRKNNCGTPLKFEKGEGKDTLLRSIPALMFPVIVLGSIYTGWATPTEAAAISVVYVMAIEKFLYKTVLFKDFAKQFFDSLVTSATLLSIIGTASVLSYFITMKRIPDAVVAFIESFVSSPAMLLILVLIFLFIAGCFVDTISLIVVLAPILVPVLNSYGINLIFFGILAVLCSQVGYISPPFGTNLFVTMRVSNKSFGFVSKSIVPYIIIIMGFTLLISLFPDLVLLLPSRMMG